MKLLRLLPFVMGGAALSSPSYGQTTDLFNAELVDQAHVKAAWAKAQGDINGDGLPDLVVGGHQAVEPALIDKVKIKLGMASWPKGNLVWYQNPGWEPHPITTDYKARTDLEVADVDGDGKNDLVLLTNQGVLWLKNPTWEPSPIIDEKQYHDLEVLDLDQDGDLDIVLRDQSLFEHNRGNEVVIYFQEEGNSWKRSVLEAPHGEGLAVTDMNNDGFADILVNDIGFINPGKQAGDWSRFTYTHDWNWPDVYIDTADFNNDGRLDVVLSPSEEAGKHYQLAWFEAPEDLAGSWKKHVVDPKVEAVLHFVAARDVDLDGRVDVLTAEMNQGKDPDEVKVYLAGADGSWTKQVLSEKGGHSLRAFDVDHDMDVDLFGANWQIDGKETPYPVTLWRNQAADKESKRWKRIEIDGNRPYRALLMFSADFNGDGFPDVATAGTWYENSGGDLTKWKSHQLPEKARNVAWVGDIDKDGDTDILATEWSGVLADPTIIDRALNRLRIRKYDYAQGKHGQRFNWGENDGKGNFTWHYNIPDASGKYDFLQGTVDIETPKGTQIVLSWHKWDFPLEAYEIPEDPVNEPWRLVKLSDTTQGEEVSSIDIDQDGLKDLLLGTVWMKNTGTSWEKRTFVETDTLPDRNVIADMNGDGQDDVVIGYEIVNTPGKLAWYERQDKGLWKEHIISLDFVIGTSSVDVADIDMDGDMDVYVGEHNTKNEERARLFWFENLKGDGSEWAGRLIHLGDEHHNGTVAVDLDKDGDMDVVSIGFRHNRVVAYINPTIP